MKLPTFFYATQRRNGIFFVFKCCFSTFVGIVDIWCVFRRIWEEKKNVVERSQPNSYRWHTKNDNGQLTALMQHNTMPSTRIPQIIDADHAKMPHHFLTLKIFPHIFRSLSFSPIIRSVISASRVGAFFSILFDGIFFLGGCASLSLKLNVSLALCTFRQHWRGEYIRSHFFFAIYTVTLLVYIYAYIWMVTSSP